MIYSGTKRNKTLCHDALLGLVLLAAAMVAGCASPLERLKNSATEDGNTFVRLDAGDFQLSAIVPPKQMLKTITIYIEGDGRNWPGGQLPQDPTPMNSPVLQLSQLDPAPGVIYLARPCQYLSSKDISGCASIYWSTHRYAQLVIDAYHKAIDDLKVRYEATTIELIGYSGGGAVATLLTAGRNDVALLVTIAGLFDHQAWTKRHAISPLDGSLNPINFAAKTMATPQVHLIGSDDPVIATSQAKSFMAAILKSGDREKRAQMRVIEGFDHACFWADIWSAEIAAARDFAKKP